MLGPLHLLHRLSNAGCKAACLQSNRPCDTHQVKVAARQFQCCQWLSALSGRMKHVRAGYNHLKNAFARLAPEFTVPDEGAHLGCVGLGE